MSPVTVLLSYPAPDAHRTSDRISFGRELHRFLAGAGFAVIEHRLGSPPAVDFGPVGVAVVEVGDSVESAGAQTRRWRAELGDRILPVMWVAPAGAVAAGLDAGADAVLVRPIEPDVFVAQLHAMARTNAIAARQAARAKEARLLGDQLRNALADLAREHFMIRRVRAAMLPRSLPMVGAARFHACYRPRGRAGADFLDVRRLDEHHVGFFVGDVVSTGAAASGALGLYVQQTMVMKEIGELSYRIVPPGEVLTGVNRALLELGTDEHPLVAMLAGVLNTRTGAVTLARAGLPAAVHVPAIDPPCAWNVPGPFLGTAHTTYETSSGTLAPGDRLLIGTDGTRPSGTPDPSEPTHLIEAAVKHRMLTGSAFADTVARELLQNVRHADDFTLLCVEMTQSRTEPPGAVVAGEQSS
jgi:hypothetical protein